MITVVNKSTAVTDRDVKAMVRAVATQVRLHAAPAWHRSPVPVVWASTEADAQPGSWVIAVLDDADQADALGWHTEEQGELIYGRVFAQPVLDAGGDALTRPLSVASVLSHEALEVLVDPSCNLWADTGTGSAVAVEICDPVESASYPVAVRGAGQVTVSDFVTPAWFDPQARTGDQFDHLRRCTMPFQLGIGGYAVVMAEGQVSAVYGEHYPAWRKATKQTPLARSARRVHKKEI